MSSNGDGEVRGLDDVAYSMRGRQFVAQLSRQEREIVRLRVSEAAIAAEKKAREVERAQEQGRVYKERAEKAETRLRQLEEERAAHAEAMEDVDV